MGLVSKALVDYLKHHHLADQEATDNASRLDTWIGNWCKDEVATLQAIETFLGLPYRSAADKSFVLVACLAKDWAIYRVGNEDGLYCVKLPDEARWRAYKHQFSTEKLYITDDNVVYSNILMQMSPPFVASSGGLTSWLSLEQLLKKEQGHIDHMIGHMLIDAIHQEATDIHLYTREHSFCIEFRCGGQIHLYATLAVDIAPMFINKLKLLADMDVSEHRMPQDGHFAGYIGKEDYYHFRLATLPLREGEKIVIRVLMEKQRFISLSTLDYLPEEVEALHHYLRNGQGLFLITGPTNSGKTTSLYAMLRYLAEEGKLIYSIEDPIEVVLPQVQQMQVNYKAGFDFAAGLRGILRGDPDVIAIGELRDAETVAIAARAALSGSLVIATLHAFHCHQAIGRLRDLGLSDLLISSVVSMIINQRLAPKQCPSCQGSGWDGHRCCPTCLGEGYLGRSGQHEIWVLDDEDKMMIEQGSNIYHLREASIEKGFRCLR